MNYSNPPVLNGTDKQNTQALRDFLVRLVRELNNVEVSQVKTSGTYKTINGQKVYVQQEASSEEISKVMKNAQELKALIIKTAQDLGTSIVAGDAAVKDYADEEIGDLDQRMQTADEFLKNYTDGEVSDLSIALNAAMQSGDSYVMNYTNAQVDGLDAKMQQLYVAHSEFGTFVESVDRKIENTAKDTVESYGYRELISSAQNTADEANQLIQNYSYTIDSQIRRGLVLDPDTGEYVTGIAIAQNLQFTGEVITGTDGQQYYKMSTGQTFGLYTSTGWQFWIDGHKKGWYNSLDGMLHIANVLIEQTLQFGDSVQMIVDSSGKFGMKMIRSS